MGASIANGIVGRFAPSPTGRMHAGNIFAALMSWLIVKCQGGKMVLRIEDLDVERSRREYADQVMRDLDSLGLTWDDGPYYQQDRDDAYKAAFDELSNRGLVYPCFCSRADIKALSAPHRGEKTVYPGTCRGLSAEEALKRAETRRPAWRLRVPDARFGIDDFVQGPYEQNLCADCGDFVIRRSDGLFAYQLASVVDDAAQGVNFIVRGVDLLPSTPQQAYLQGLLGLNACAYAHVPLLVAKRDRRLSKRDHDASLDVMLDELRTPEGVLGHIAFVCGLKGEEGPVSAEELLACFELDALPTMFSDKIQIPWR